MSSFVDNIFCAWYYVRMAKTVYWANLRKDTEQSVYIELNQISRGRWKVTFDFEEIIVKTTSTDPLEILHLATGLRRHRNP